MKSLFLVTAAVAVASTASAYVCPDIPTVSYACRQLNVFPLVCYNPRLNVKKCNEKQCNQQYVDYYAACQCRRITIDFYEHSRNVEGLIYRCGGGLTNPYGNSTQYRPGEGTASFTKTANGPVATRIYDGTTYYGGQTTVISGSTRIVSATAVVGQTTILPGTTTWVSGTPGIIRGTSTPSGPLPTGATRYYNGTTYYGGQTGVVSGTTRIVSATAIVNGTWIAPGTTTWVSGTPGIIRGTSSQRTGTRTRTGGNGATATAQPVLAPSETPIAITTQGISGGAIAGIVLGILGAALLAALLALCWRKKRAAHVAALGSTHIAHEPTRTTVVEKIEPVVVKSVPAAETYHASSVPVAGASGAAYGANAGHGGAAYDTGNSYNAGNNNGYNTQPRV
ncbi:hypothetical protein BGZ81_001936 [Podila clonocystis]|nr:hypothetical protein BGZ81_001936 [Podila clonocystis]